MADKAERELAMLRLADELNAERKALRSQLAEVTRERDEALAKLRRNEDDWIEHWNAKCHENIELRSDLTAALKVVEAARYSLPAWPSNVASDVQLSNALRAFDARKDSGGENAAQARDEVAEACGVIPKASSAVSGDTKLPASPPAGGSLPGLVDAAIERVAAACERAAGRMRDPFALTFIRLAEELRKGGG